MTKKDQTPPRGGPRGVWQKTTVFSGFFCATFPYVMFLLPFYIALVPLMIRPFHYDVQVPMTLTMPDA